MSEENAYSPAVTIYSLTPLDYPLLNKAGFQTQGLFWDLLWATDNKGALWQVSMDEDAYLKFYEHDKDMRRVAEPRNMTRQEFLERFGV